MARTTSHNEAFGQLPPRLGELHAAYTPGLDEYCFADADCPPEHICLGTNAADFSSSPAAGTPSCLLRTIFADGRLEAAEASLRNPLIDVDADPHHNLRGARNLLIPVIDQLNAGIRSALQLAVPRRAFTGTAPLEGNFALDSIDTVSLAITGVRIQSALPPADGNVPGSGEIAFYLMTSPVVVSGREEAQEIGVVDKRYSLLIHVAAVRIMARPVVRLARDGAGVESGKLTFRVTSAMALSALGTGPRHPDVPLSIVDVDITEGGNFAVEIAKEAVRLGLASGELPDFGSSIPAGVGDALGQIEQTVEETLPIGVGAFGEPSGNNLIGASSTLESSVIGPADTDFGTGVSCTATAQCVLGEICVEGGFCSRPCTSDCGCPTGYACAPRGGVRACFPGTNACGSQPPPGSASAAGGNMDLRYHGPRTAGRDPVFYVSDASGAFLICGALMSYYPGVVAPVPMCSP